MRLRDGLAGGALAGIGCLCLGACDDFKSRPARSATPPPAGPVARPAAVAAQPAPVAQLAPQPGDQALAGAPQPVLDPAQGASTPEGQAIDAADFTPTASGERDLIIRAQVILARAHFSPGVIDGRAGANFGRALAAFEAAHGVAGADEAPATLDAAAWRALIAADSAPVMQDYVIGADDVKGPFLGVVPKTLAAEAKLPHLDYATPLQAMAEKFHMDQGLLRALNPGVDFAKAGTRILVARPQADPIPPVARVEVDKTADEVRAYDGQGKVVAAFPATVGSAERPAPTGTWAVKAVVSNPNYTYDPDRLTFGNPTTGKLTIRPGPNNPVGSTWIDLTVPTYGIHGAPDPTRIGKTESHGCVRLTNWDAAALGKAVKKGTPVVFVGAAAGEA